ncbi:MAG: hypothetical protein RBU29_04185, partial [bacterium]|nr:hypothetical protein [bacterium]
MRPLFRLGILHCTAALLILSQGYTQPILLHHQFTPGQTAQSHTAIKMQGNTLIGGEDAKTNLSIQMLKHLRVGMVDPSGEAELSLILDRIKTQGTMNNENFNQDLTGDALKSVMFGMTKEDLTISPQGAVRGHDDLSSLSQLGISLPSSPSNHGEFEFPTFPSEPVQLGSEWTESGMLIRERRVGFSEGTGVYKLLRITSSPFGRAAVIQYKKTTDLSGMALGNMASSGPGIQGISTGSAIQGLVISLEGEIVFLIDHGLVWKTT